MDKQRQQSSGICYILLIMFILLPMEVLGSEPAVAPSVPLTVSFAGQKIDLGRLDLYERLDKELISFTFGHTNTFLTIKRANRYLPELVKILKEQGVPEDFVYLAAIESHYDNTAVSGARAAGMWQLMPATAKEYGLEVTDFVDERYDYEKSTVAACKYLKKAYAKYGCWLSVAAAYNAGMGRISNSFAEQKVTQVTDLYLNKETSRYIFRLLAMKLIMDNPRAFGFKIEPSQLYQPISYTTVNVEESVDSWVDWANSQGITYALLREANPWIRKDSLPNSKKKRYVVKIPKEDSLFRDKVPSETFNENWVK